MQNSLLTSLPFYLMLSFLVGCGLDCVDKKTGMPKSSQTLQQAQANDLFQFEFVPDQSTFHLDSGLVFTIKNAWVENSWRYECINGWAKIVKDSSFQFVIDAEYQGSPRFSNYWLGNSHLGAQLCYGYSGQDIIVANLCKDTSYTLTSNKQLEATLIFVKKDRH